MTRTIVYCHGLPGSPNELSAFAPAPATIQPLDRLGQPRASYEEAVLSAFDAVGLDAPVTVAGFSLGAMAAVLIAAKRSALVQRLILISPAAPLQLGTFLPAMAGRPVFEAAQRGDFALRSFTAAQAALVALAPRAALAAMFRGSPEAERRLLASPRFVETVTAGLRACLGPRQAAYRQELRAYVRPWAHLLGDIRCETEIWSGSADDWTPPGMAEAYRTQLGARASAHVCPGLGHYSTLQTALARLS